MGRDNVIKTSDSEKELLDEVTKRWFGTNEVPYGYVIERLCMEKLALFEVSEDYEEGSNQNFLRDQDIEKILDAYHNFEDIEKYCRVADMEEIERNDFNLNVPRYVDTTEEEEPVDVEEVITELDQLEKERDEIESEMMGYLKELGYNG